MNRIMTLVAASLCGGALVYGCSSSSNSATGGKDAGSDGSASDGALHKEAAPSGDDSGGDDSSASTCPTPADISSWTPPAYVPAKSSPGACAPGDVAAYDAACLAQGSSSQTACQAFEMAHATCSACILSKSTDSTWGPLISWGGVVNVNLGGCIELVTPSDTSCAKAQEVAMTCPHVACDMVCPVTSGNQASFTQWQACTQTADADACGTFVNAAACLGTDDGSTGTLCDPATSAGTFDSLFLQIAPLFCGGGGDGGATEAGPAEGGTEAGAPDAPAG